MGTVSGDPIIVRIGDFVQVGDRVAQIKSYTTSIYGPPTIELEWRILYAKKRAKVLYHNDVVDLHGAFFRVIKDDNGPDFHFQSTAWELEQPTAPADKRLPIRMGRDLVGHALVRSDGKILVIELNDDAGTIISKGLEWNLTKSLSIAPNQEN